jgi:hypothetical protein
MISWARGPGSDVTNSGTVIPPQSTDQAALGAVRTGPTSSRIRLSCSADVGGIAIEIFMLMKRGNVVTEVTRATTSSQPDPPYATRSASATLMVPLVSKRTKPDTKRRMARDVKRLE